MPRILHRVYVDPLRQYGWQIKGKSFRSCHMFVCHGVDLEVLHEMAYFLGIKRAYFQPDYDLPHYDLLPSSRHFAVQAGAIEVPSSFLIEQMRLYKSQYVRST
jgi:hypothetical protein